MSQDGNLMFGIGAAGCAFLLIAHVCLGSGESEPTGTPVPVVAKKPTDPGKLSDAEKWEAWRAQRTPSLTDSRGEREEKQFSETMRAHRQQPVEVVDDPGRGSGLVEIGSIDDLRKLLEQGGSYSGPLPPELMSDSPVPAPSATSEKGAKK